jgi:hypothetical protein
MKVSVFTLILTSLSVGAMAQTREPASIRQPSKSYLGLRPVQLAPAHQPKYKQGIDTLKNRELRFQEKLPLQLSQAVKKISLKSYR